MGQLVRLQKHLARAGVASRRAAEVAIGEGRVRVNGRVVREMGTKVDPDRDVVDFDGRRIRLAPAVWIALNKPRGFVCTRSDPRHRPTIFDLLPAEYHSLFHVGRLDADSEGLLLLTNDGDRAQYLLHPRYRAERVYLADIEGVPGEAALKMLRSGVQLEDGIARARRVRIRKAHGDRTRIQIVMGQGRKRVVRRMLAAVGHTVQRLRRIRHGAIRLGSLAAGEWRVVDPAELDIDENRAQRNADSMGKRHRSREPRSD